MSKDDMVNIEPKPKTVPAPVRMVKIILEENDDIPPTGLFLGHNGTGYLLKTGEPVEVPWFLQDILDHAVMLMPVVDPQFKSISGFRERMKYPYRLVA